MRKRSSLEGGGGFGTDCTAEGEAEGVGEEDGGGAAGVETGKGRGAVAGDADLTEETVDFFRVPAMLTATG